ncbi:restriction endonuclease [Streptomyces antimycoticus]|uniref:McrC family protein n=1 Tax=Streptomyces antimycoticus TaxID=68175 RepID=UPI0033F535A4
MAAEGDVRATRTVATGRAAIPDPRSSRSRVQQGQRTPAEWAPLRTHVPKTRATRRGRTALLVDLAEGGNWKPWTLTDAQVDTLSTKEVAKILDIRPARNRRSNASWELKAKRTVGAVRLGTGDGMVMVRIAPKVAVDRLLYLLAHAQQKRLRWQPDPVDAAVRHELFSAIAHAFTRAAERALRPGLLAGYRGREDTAMMLRGRLRAAAQLRRRPGLALPLEIAYDEHTTDIPENQLLLGAARRLARLPDMPPRLHTGLRQLDALLDGVTAPSPGAPVAAWTPTRLNARYVPALRLAEIVLRGASFEYTDGRPVSVDGLLLNMEKVFEDFLASALGTALERHAGGRSQPHPRTHHLDDRQEHQLLPDLVHRLQGADGGLHPAIVVDAKYQDGTTSSNLYQMLAYCTCFGLSEGHLVSAAGMENEGGIRVPVPGGAIRLYRHVLDLSLPYPELAARIDELAQVIAAARTTVPRARGGPGA